MDPDKLNDLVNGYISLMEEIQESENDDDHLKVVNQVLSRHMDAVQTSRDRDEFTKELLAVKAERLVTSMERIRGEEGDEGKLEELDLLLEEVRDLHRIARYGI